MTLVEATTAIQNIVLALCGVATVAIAFVGLKTWWNELKGRSEYTRAKEVLKAVYKVRRGFLHVRNPGIYAYEYPEHMRDEFGHLKPEYRAEGTTLVYENRLKMLDSAFQELEEQTLDAEVEWGAEFQSVIVPLRKCRIELLFALQNHVEAMKHPGSRRGIPEKERAEQRSVLYHLGEDSEHDKFTPQINSAIQEFEKRLRPHIKKK